MPLLRPRRAQTVDARPPRLALAVGLIVLFACALAVSNCGRTDLASSEIVGGLPASCQTDADCVSTPTAPFCDQSSGTCVQCTNAMQCPTGEACQDFVCAARCGMGTECPSGSACCGGSCANEIVDPGNCGACGLACAPGQTCFAGLCTDPACGKGLTACANACVDENNDPNNCGGCGIVCSPGQKCAGRACISSSTSCRNTGCARGLTCCGDACVDANADQKNCGGCGVACLPNQKCLRGACIGPPATCMNTGCGRGTTCCGDACIDTFGDPRNCGACGRLCPSGDVCIGGSCTQPGCNGGPGCAPGQTCCGAGCIDTTSDPRNCGQCASACGAPPRAFATCASGACQFACAPGFADCDGNPSNGCEIDLSSSGANCGRCGANCAPGSLCVGSSCTSSCACPAPEVCCGADGTTCTDTTTDPNHCGGCGSVCSTGTACIGGTCVGMSEGAFDPIVNPTYLTPGVHNFTTINVPRDVVVYVAGAGSPSGTLELRATGDVNIDGTIDVSGGPGSQNTIASQTTNSGRAGCGGDTGQLTTAPPPIACGFVSGNGGRNGAGPVGATGGCPAGPVICDGSMPLLFAAPPARFGGGAGVFTGYRAYGSGGGGPAGGAPGALGAPFLGEADCSGASGGGGATNGGGGRAAGAPYDGANGTLGQTQCLGELGGARQAFVGGGGGGSIGVAAASDLSVAMTFQTGSGGGGGSADYLDRPAFGGTSGGGGGGGALKISTSARLVVGGQLLARGGYGADAFIGNGRIANCDPQPGAAGGGGSGGIIYLQAPTISVAASATIATDGGVGGSASEFATGGAGGSGGLGRIRLSVNPVSCTLLGTLNPPAAAGCAPTMVAAPGSAFVGVYPM